MQGFDDHFTFFRNDAIFKVNMILTGPESRRQRPKVVHLTLSMFNPETLHVMQAKKSRKVYLKVHIYSV